MKPAEIVSMLSVDEELHDSTVLILTESLDGWRKCGYIYNDNVVMLAQKYTIDGKLVGDVLTSVVPVADYDSIMSAAHSYWDLNRSLP